jgi:ATP-binding cassette, subfamily B, multidrug efflux pump
MCFMIGEGGTVVPERHTKQQNHSHQGKRNEIRSAGVQRGNGPGGGDATGVSRRNMDARAGAQQGGGPGRGPRKGPAPKGSSVVLLFRLLSYLKHHRGLFLIVLGVSVLTASLDLLPPWVIRLSVDRVILGDGGPRLFWVAVALMILAVFHGTSDFLRLYLTAQLGQRAVFRIRTALFAHLSRLSFSFYDSARTGDMVTRTTADVDTLSQFFGRSATIILTNFLFLIGILVVLVSWNWLLAVAYLVMLPVIVLGMLVYARTVRPVMGKVRRQLSELTSRLETMLSGILAVKVFGREPYEAKRFEKASAGYRSASIAAIRITALWMPIADVIMGVGTGVVLLAGGYGVIRGGVSIGTLIAFTMYIGMLLRPIRQTGMMLSVTMQSLAAAERVFEVLDTTPEVQDRPGARKLTVNDGSIEFRDVGFSYDGTHRAVDGVSFRIEPGELVALVGPSGAGKSTLVHLLLRFYELKEGSILIDGTDIREVKLMSLRSNLGIAMQNVFVFDTSIGDNIRYGNPDASQDDVEQSARTVQLHDFIASLPLGYDTPVGERGLELSGGQRQRLALARVLLRDPSILLLDEPTSSLDSATERMMSAALDAARKGRTTMVIAHRLWTVHHADRILVLEGGKLVEVGAAESGMTAHERLMERDGLYRKLYDLQFIGETGSSSTEGGKQS